MWPSARCLSPAPFPLGCLSVSFLFFLLFLKDFLSTEAGEEEEESNGHLCTTLSASNNGGASWCGVALITGAVHY